MADQLDEAQESVDRAQERVREMEAKLSHYEKVELALQEALESARETARRSEATAEEKAKLMIQEAELRAEKILHDAERERHGLRQDLVRLNARQAEVAARLRGFLLSELEVLAQFQGDDPVGFIKLQAAGGQSGGAQGALPRHTARLEAPTEEPENFDDEAYEEGPPAASETNAPSARPATGEPEPPIAAPLEHASEPEAPSPPEPPTPAASPAEPADEVPPAERESWPPKGSLPGAYAAAEEPPAPEPEPEESPAEPEDATPPPAVTGGWDLRSLVTGSEQKNERNVAGSEEERDRIRRILDDLE